jgi:hypothetical protein
MTDLFHVILGAALQVESKTGSGNPAPPRKPRKGSPPCGFAIFSISAPRAAGIMPAAEAVIPTRAARDHHQLAVGLQLLQQSFSPLSSLSSPARYYAAARASLRHAEPLEQSRF